MIGIQQARPPFVEFKQIARHDPRRSQEVGYRVTKDVDMAFIMQPGSRDQVEIEASAWLDSIRRKMIDAAPDAYPQEWVEGFKKKYEAWKAGLDAPLNGTSVKEWPLLSPAQVQNFQAIGLMTIEDVSAMTEEAMGRVGMGARELRDKARQFLTAKDVAATAIAERDERISALEAKIAELEADKPKRGRPKLVQAA